MVKRKRPNYHASFMVERSPISKQSSRNKNKEIEQIRSKALSEKQARTGTQVHQNGQTGGRGSASEDLSDSQVHHNSQTSGNRNAAQDLSGISITSKRKRGPTKLQSIHKQIEPIQVDFNPDGEAIAQGGKALGQYIGYLSRDSSVMPLNFDDWRHVPVDVKQEIRNLLEAKFIINWVVGGRWVNEKLAHRWRNRKSALKTKYYESRNDEETINGLKNEVGENQWDWLVKFWESEKGQERSATSKVNRSKLKTNHTAGTKSFARISSLPHPIKNLSLRHRLLAKPATTKLSLSTKATPVSATISVGDKLPDATLSYFDSAGELQTITVSDLTSNKKAILFAVPGAFTPTCSQKHLPGFVEKSAELKSKGVDTVACISVNDAFVMRAWKENLGINDEVLLLSDGNGVFTKAIGCELDLSDKPMGLGVRSRRYALLAENGVVKVLNLEEGGAFTFSGAEDMLKAL